MRRLEDPGSLKMVKAVRLILAFLLLILCFGTPLLMKHFTKGFHLARIDLQLESNPKWDVAYSDLEKDSALKILSQPFTYLNRGAQCFVFESQDHSYVIKIFQENRQVTPYTRWKLKKKQKKMIDFSPCLRAHHELRNQTALIYLHLNPTEGELPTIPIRDPLGRRYLLNLDRYSFVVQKKVKPLFEALKEASVNGDLPSLLHSYFSLLDFRVKKGIWNVDQSIESNFGFLGNEAIEIDFGHLIQASVFLREGYQDLEKGLFVAKLREFIEIKIPSESKLFESELARYLHETNRDP